MNYQFHDAQKNFLIARRVVIGAVIFIVLFLAGLQLWNAHVRSVSSLGKHRLMLTKTEDSWSGKSDIRKILWKIKENEGFFLTFVLLGGIKEFQRLNENRELEKVRDNEIRVVIVKHDLPRFYHGKTFAFASKAAAKEILDDRSLLFNLRHGEFDLGIREIMQVIFKFMKPAQKYNLGI